MAVPHSQSNCHKDPRKSFTHHFAFPPSSKGVPRNGQMESRPAESSKQKAKGHRVRAHPEALRDQRLAPTGVRQLPSSNPSQGQMWERPSMASARVLGNSRHPQTYSRSRKESIKVESPRREATGPRVLSNGPEIRMTPHRHLWKAPPGHSQPLSNRARTSTRITR